MPIMSTILAFIGNGVMGFSKEIYTIQHEDKAPLTLVTAQQRQLAKLFFACSNAGALKSNQRTGAVFVCVLVSRRIICLPQFRAPPYFGV